MRKPSNSALAKALDKNVQTYAQDSGSDTGSETDNASVVSLSTCEEDTEEEDEIQERSRSTGHSREFHVIDGGDLFRRVIWGKSLTYNEIIQKYINYVQSRYGKYAVFDGYRDEPSTKDHEHRSRLMQIVISRDVCVNLESESSSASQRAFLSNARNKQFSIDLLADGLKSNGHTVKVSVMLMQILYVKFWTLLVEGKMLFWLERTHIFSSYFFIR